MLKSGSKTSEFKVVVVFEAIAAVLVGVGIWEAQQAEDATLAVASIAAAVVVLFPLLAVVWKYIDGRIQLKRVWLGLNALNDDPATRVEISTDV